MGFLLFDSRLAVEEVVPLRRFAPRVLEAARVVLNHEVRRLENKVPRVPLTGAMPLAQLPLHNAIVEERRSAARGDIGDAASVEGTAPVRGRGVHFDKVRVVRDARLPLAREVGVEEQLRKVEHHHAERAPR